MVRAAPAPEGVWTANHAADFQPLGTVAWPEFGSAEPHPGLAIGLDGEDWRPLQAVQQLVFDDHPAVAELQDVFLDPVVTFTHEDDAATLLVVSELHDGVFQPASPVFELERLREGVETFGGKSFEGSAPAGRTKGGRRFTPEPSVVAVLARAHHELTTAIGAFTDVDEHPRGELRFVTGEWFCAAV